MKFLIPMAILAIAGVSAEKCLADYIVTRCLGTEQDKADACHAIDYDCQCAAYQAIATCYNNCPDDPRATSANQQVSIYCANASLYGTASATKTMSAGNSSMTAGATASATPIDDIDDTTVASSSASAEAPEKTGAAVDLKSNVGGLVGLVVGVVAAVL